MFILRLLHYVSKGLLFLMTAVSQVTVRPTMSGSPYKKPQSSSSQLAKNRLASVSNPTHTSEEVERLKVRSLKYDYKNKKKIVVI